MQHPTPANPKQGLTHNDVAYTLERLEILLNHPQTPEFSTALKILITALMGWGDILGLTDFVAFAQTTETLMQAHPDQIPIIAPLALQGFRAIYQQQVLIDQHGQPSTVALTPPDNPVPPVSVGNNIESDVNINIPLAQGSQTALETTNLFVWEAQSLIFTVPSEQVLEIVIPVPDQVMTSEGALTLTWRDQIVPIYQVQSPSRTPSALDNIELSRAVRLESTTPSELPSMLVVQTNNRILALATNTDALVTETVLPLMQLTSESQLPPYCHGYTQRSNHPQPTLVLNLAVLVDAHFHPPLNASSPADAAATIGNALNRAVPDPSSPLFSAVTILCVDDSTTLRHVLATRLQAAGYEVIQAPDGQVALEKLQQEPAIQLVICDIEMPNMNGFEFIRHCRSDPALAVIPIVMLSTQKNPQHQDLAKSLGANAYFSKLYNKSEFLDTLQSLLDVSQPRVSQFKAVEHMRE